MQQYTDMSYRSITRQDLIDMKNKPGRITVLQDYNSCTDDVKDQAALSFRRALDRFPSSFFMAPNSFVFDFKIDIKKPPLPINNK